MKTPNPNQKGAVRPLPEREKSDRPVGGGELDESSDFIERFERLATLLDRLYLAAHSSNPQATSAGASGEPGAKGSIETDDGKRAA